MKGFISVVVLTLALGGAAEALAQDPAATPTPSPTPAATPPVVPVDDKQDVRPEDLQGVPAIAPGYRSEDRGFPDLGRVGVDMVDQKPLSLSEAITMALENNMDIEVTRKNVRIAEFDLKAARGFYEPRFTGRVQYEDATVPNVSVFTSNLKNRSQTLVGNALLTGYIPRFGSVLSAEIVNQNVSTNNPITVLSPQYNANLNLTLTQPLFRGRSFDQPRRAIEIAKRNLSLTDTQFRQTTIEIIANVQRAYWDLTYALRNLQVQRDSLKDAKDQLAHNRRLVDEGQLAPIDVVAADTQVALFEQAVYDALNVVSQAENALKAMISPNRTDGIWAESVLPVDPVDLDAPRTTLTEALTAALENRPELEIMNVQEDINEIDRRFYKELKKPQIDLVAGYSSTGIGGSENSSFSPSFPTPCQQDPNSEACQQQRAALAQLTGNPYAALLRNQYPTFRVGVQFNLPLFGDKTARAQYGRSLVEGERLQTQREQLEQNIQVDVRNALQAVRTAEARLRSAAIARENSVAQYESEQRKLDAGQSDIYKVLERQTALATARSNELRAQTELNKAIADLQRATGNSLKANNIEARLR